MSRRTRRGVILLFVLSLALAWLSRVQEPADGGPIAGLDRRLDYALTDFEMQVFDEEGLLSITLRAPRLANDAGTGVGRVEQPRIEVHHEEFDWQVDAEVAVVTSDRETIDLPGPARVRRDGPAPADWLTADGRDIRLQVTPRIATSEQEVELNDSAGRLTGRGFRLDMRRNKFELHEQVAGRYELDTPESRD